MAATRDYETILTAVLEALRPDMDVRRRMEVVVDLLWEHLHDQGVSWVGFYVQEQPDGPLLLGPRRDQPACSPIGLHGACGQALMRDTPLVVRDVAELGKDYIACDPRDRSEVVIPLHDDRGRPSGVLDLDSHDLAAFDDHDVAGLTRVLQVAELH